MIAAACGLNPEPLPRLLLVQLTKFNIKMINSGTYYQKVTFSKLSSFLFRIITCSHPGMEIIWRRLRRTIYFLFGLKREICSYDISR